MKYWLIAGLRDPRFQDTLRSNLTRLQGDFETELVIVETGDAVGCFSGALREDTLGVVPFLRTAMEYVRVHAAPDDWFVRIDADDYYGPAYLRGVDQVRQHGAHGTGIPSVFVKTEDDHLYFCRSKRSTFRGACGGTLAGRVQDALDFPDTGSPWGEDSAWVESMVDAGFTMLPRASTDYALVRWEGAVHTYPVAGHALPHFWMCDAYDLGAWSENKVARPFFGKGKPLPLDMTLCFQGVAALKQRLVV